MDEVQGARSNQRLPVKESSVADTDNRRCSPVKHTGGCTEKDFGGKEDAIESCSINLADANDNGQATTKERGGFTQGGDSGTSRQKQTCEPSGLCASRTDEELAYTDEQRTQVSTEGGYATEQMFRCEGSEGGAWWHTDPAEVGTTEPIVGRVAHGVANRVDRLKAVGNGQVPEVARLAWEILSENNK